MRNNNKVYLVIEVLGNEYERKLGVKFITQQKNIAEKYSRIKTEKSRNNEDFLYCEVAEFDFKTNAELMKMINDLEMTE